MAKMKMYGTEEYALKLSKLAANSKEVAEKAIQEAAGIVTDQVRANIQALPAVKEIENIKAYKEGGKSHLSIRQKEGLLESLGITPVAMDNGFYNAKIGFDGYNSIRTKKYPKGQPNQLIARVVESGSTYMDKTPFMRKALTATRGKAMQRMQEVIDDEFKKIMK